MLWNRSTVTHRLRALLLLVPMLAVCSLPGRAQSASNPGVEELDDVAGYSQVLALSDVHGMYRNLNRLLNAAKVTNASGRWIAGRTLLIVVGDSIDKGPESLPILEMWMRLRAQAQANGGRLIVLLGNHEAEFLNQPKSRKAGAFLEEIERAGMDPLELAAGKDKRGIGNFLRAMPLAARVGKVLFAHAGWYPENLPWTEFVIRSRRLLRAGLYGDAFITGEHSILEEKAETDSGGDPEKWYDDPVHVRKLEARIDTLHLYGVVFGHQPKAFHFKGEIGAVDDFRLIKIDTGMAPDADGSPGEILHFPHPADLLRLAPPAADRLLANGRTAPINVKKTDSTNN